MDRSGSILVAWNELGKGERLQFPHACSSHWQSSSTYLGGVNKKKRLKHITMAIHAGISKFSRLRLSIQRWNGLVSAAVYVTSRLELHQALELCHEEKNRLATEQLAIHFYMEKPTSGNPLQEYPHNVLRQMALHHAPTDFVLTADADFVTAPDASQQLHQFFRETKRTITTKKNQTMSTSLWEKLLSRHLLVVPAFEGHVPVDESKLLLKGEGAQMLDQALPRNKLQVQSFVQDRKVTPFHVDMFPADHGATNFDKWLTINATQRSPSYPIDYTVRFEPYVVAWKVGLPSYWPTFRGFGFNKWTLFAEAYLAGYNFEVLKCDVCFVTHVHQTRSHRPMTETSSSNRKAYEAWQAHIRETYNWGEGGMNWMLMDRKELKQKSVEGPPKEWTQISIEGPRGIPRLAAWTVWKQRAVGRIFPAKYDDNDNGKNSSSRGGLYHRPGEWIGTAPLVVPTEKATTFYLKPGMTLMSTSGRRYYLSNETLQWDMH